MLNVPALINIERDENKECPVWIKRIQISCFNHFVVNTPTLVIKKEMG